MSEYLFFFMPSCFITNRHWALLALWALKLFYHPVVVWNYLLSHQKESFGEILGGMSRYQLHIHYCLH